MTPEEFIAEAKRRGKSKEETRRKFLKLKEAGAFDREPATPEVSAIDTARGALTAYNRGTSLGAADEIVGFGRALIDPLIGAAAGEERPFQNYFSSFGERQQQYVDDERRVRDEFAARNPKTAMALEFAGAATSPVNRLGTGAQAERLASRAPRLRQALTGGGTGERMARGALRGGAEGAAAGFLEGEGGFSERAQNMSAPAAVGATLGGVLPGAVSAYSARRVARDLGKGENFTPLNMAAPDSNVGSFYRNYIGTAIGGRGPLQRQESQAIANNPRLRRAFGQQMDEVAPKGMGATDSVDELTQRLTF